MGGGTVHVHLQKGDGLRMVIYGIPHVLYQMLLTGWGLQPGRTVTSGEDKSPNPTASTMLRLFTLLSSRIMDHGQTLRGRHA